jgi:hypothetical protein
VFAHHIETTQNHHLVRPWVASTVGMAADADAGICADTLAECSRGTYHQHPQKIRRVVASASSVSAGATSAPAASAPPESANASSSDTGTGCHRHVLSTCGAEAQASGDAGSRRAPVNGIVARCCPLMLPPCCPRRPPCCPMLPMLPQAAHAAPCCPCCPYAALIRGIVFCCDVAQNVSTGASGFVGSMCMRPALGAHNRVFGALF